MGHRIELPTELGATFSTRRALGLGVGRTRLANRELARPHHGVRALPGWLEPASGDATEEEAQRHRLLARLRAYESRMHGDHFFSHTTAAELWRIPLPPSLLGAIHVSALVPSKGPAGVGTIGHRLSDQGVSPLQIEGLRVADPVSTFLQCATLLHLHDLVALGDHIILEPAFPRSGRPFATVDGIRGRLEGYRCHGGAKAVRALALMRLGAESRPETLVRLAIGRARLPEPLLAHELRSRAGLFVARLDMDYPEFGVAVEYDGDQHRTSTMQYEKDIERLDAIRRAGRHVVRLRKSALADGARPAARAVAVALAEAGCRDALRALSAKGTLSRR